LVDIFNNVKKLDKRLHTLDEKGRL
jgi:hypothetical protein